MTDLTLEPVTTTVLPRPSSARAALPLPAAILLALAGALLLTFARVQEVWGTGAFFDSDDALRAVQVRDLLGGQSWFDMTAHRIDPPHGLFMHWSRVVDAPLAALNILFGHVLAPEYAERATRLVFPFALLAVLFGLVAWLASLLSSLDHAALGRNRPNADNVIDSESLERALCEKPVPTFSQRALDARGPAVWMAFLSGAMFVQFTPGRIDHHAPQIVLLAASLGFFLRGLDPAKAKSMALSAAGMALSMAISLENLPFFAAMLAALPALFLLDGEGARRQLGWFSLGALLAFPLAYTATVGRDRYFLSACDAYSFVHLAAMATDALGLAFLAALAPRLATLRARLAGIGAAGASALACVAILAPRCLGDPLGGIDPLFRDLWLGHVVEARPLLSFWEKSPNVVVMMALPTALGLLAALAFGATRDGVARRCWFVAAAAIAAGLAAALWQVRVFTSVTPLAMASLAVAMTAIANRYGASFAPLTRAGLVGVLCLAVSPMALALAIPAPEGDADGPDFSCLKPAALAPLAELPPARVAAPVDLGSHLLAHTPHSVFAAPYHRDNHGARVVLDAFLAPPDEAEKILRAAGVDVVVWCAGGKKRNLLIERAPNGLAAGLAQGAIPDWLERKPPEGSPLLVFAVRPQN